MNEKHVKLRELCHEVATRGPKNWRPGVLEELQAELNKALENKNERTILP